MRHAFVLQSQTSATDMNLDIQGVAFCRVLVKLKISDSSTAVLLPPSGSPPPRTIWGRRGTPSDTRSLVSRCPSGPAPPATLPPDPYVARNTEADVRRVPKRVQRCRVRIPTVWRGHFLLRVQANWMRLHRASLPCLPFAIGGYKRGVKTPFPSACVRFGRRHFEVGIWLTRNGGNKQGPSCGCCSKGHAARSARGNGIRCGAFPCLVASRTRPHTRCWASPLSATAMHASGVCHDADLRMMLVVASALQYLPAFGFVAIKNR